MNGPKPTDLAMSPGTVLASRYLVERQLGIGGMATVLQVKDLRTDRVLALKVLKPDVAAHPEAVERFRREGEFLLGLKHPALIAVEAIGQLADGRLFLAMELLSGETLGERIRRGRVTPVDLSPILAGAAVGLDAAHKAGVVHRDLKPDNIFLSTPRPGGTVQVKLLDFGISKIDGRASLTRTGQVLGTPRYMAPEQLRGEEDLDERIDVYALGVILYEALTGQPAFPAVAPSELIVSILHARYTPLRALRPEISPEIEAIVVRAMSKSRQARFASAVELAQAWFEVVHRNDGPQGVRTGFATSVLGSQIDSVRPPVGLTPNDLRPATFREFEAQYDKRPPTRHIDAVDAPKLASAPGMASPDRTTPAHAVEIVQPPSQRRVGEMPAFVGPPLASLVGENVAPVVAPAVAPTSGGSTSAAAYASTIPANAAQKIIEEEAKRRAPAPSASAPAAYASSAAPVEQGTDVFVPTKRPWALIGIGVLVALALFSAIAWGLVQFIGRHDSPATPATGTASPSANPPSIPTIPSMNVPALALAVDAGGKLDAGGAIDSGTVRDAGVAQAATDEPHEHHDHGATTGTTTTTGSTTTGTTTPDPFRATGMTDGSSSTSTNPWTSNDGTSMSEPTHRATGAELLAQARQALSVGDARRCIELATEAISAGADSSVYRVRGDCYRSLGDSAHALRSYQRFCTIAPNSSQIEVVRRLAADLGGTCP